MGFPGGSESVCLQFRRPGFNPWVRKIPWRRKWQPSPVFLPGESHGRRSLVGRSPWDHRVGHNWATSLHIRTYIYILLKISFPVLVYHLHGILSIVLSVFSLLTPHWPVSSPCDAGVCAGRVGNRWPTGHSERLHTFLPSLELLIGWRREGFVWSWITE